MTYYIMYITGNSGKQGDATGESVFGQTDTGTNAKPISDADHESAVHMVNGMHKNNPPFNWANVFSVITALLVILPVIFSYFFFFQPYENRTTTLETQQKYTEKNILKIEEDVATIESYLWPRTDSQN